MTKELNFAKDLIDFIYESPSQFHAAENVEKRLVANGFGKIELTEKWELEKGGKYFIKRNDSAVVAFVLGTGEIEEKGFKLIGAHTDAPGFRIKPSPEIVSEGYLKLNTEPYGGPILNTWLDRPLSIAGRVSLKSDNPLKPENKLININKPILVIPNLAIHMNRNVNKGVELNKQKDMLPMLSVVNEEFEKDGFLIKLMAENLDVKEEEILDFEVFLYEYEKGLVMGLNNEFISSGKLDDLAMVHAGIEGLIDAGQSEITNVMVCFDNEEVGSRTKQGAGSPLLANVLEKICLSFGKGRDEFLRAIYNSFMISADMAHAVHPNVPEKHDPITKPVINKGPVIKINANQNYTTDSDSCAVYEAICKNANIPYQKMVNRSDVAGGSTIGPINSSQLNIRSVDIGNPMFAMHSIRELGGVNDHYYVKKSFEEFYNL